MKNIFKLLVIFFVFSICSCQKERCKDCQANYRFTYQGNSNGYADEQWCADYVTQQLGYSSWLEYTTALTASYPNNTQSALREICGDELRDAEYWYVEIDLDSNGINDFRLENFCYRTGNGSFWCLFC